MKKISTLLSASLLCICSSAFAGVANDIPSCYAVNKVGVPSPQTTKEFFILIDQTTPLDLNLQNSVRENVGRLITSGNSYVIASFSSFGQGKYLEIISAGTLEATVPDKQRDDIGVRALGGLDNCLKSQTDFARKTAAGALNKALSGSSSELAKSDVMATLKELSSRVKQSNAKEKIVFLVSDMLENSGISSFYTNKNVRNLDVASELKKASSSQQLGDFAGARVYVLGAGLVQEASGKGKDSGVYRDPKTMANLKNFWDEYFKQSKAQLVEFGAPALLVPVQ